ncbi:DNA-directed RNA polymerases I and III subunit RPAC1 [Sitodiplosis mosellana]|uniref:DNA-directed RNA polymerases I and III subunit RPAC1 n=1 Tax=Sitodiplosis mosellana TaxID=263140 RepID=UPI002443F824|nr:DNA-directed RNA polymerases I and III subunit RPAC1 [Sitodiplosis mosellana]
MEVDKEKPRIYLTEYKVKQDAHDYGMADDLWSFEDFKRKFRIVVVRQAYNELGTEPLLEFDLIGCLPSIANAFRRLMLSEVPSMAIEKVYMYNNTSIIQDEVLAHRLGLIPLKANPQHFEYKSEDASDDGTDQDTLEYKLKVKCTRRKDAKDTSLPDNLYENEKVYSGMIKWVPKGKQGTMFRESDVGPVHDKILISKMRPGHELDIKLLAVKGIGKDHAKFSPVSTATYRLLPEITMKQTVTGEDAKILQSCFSPGVIEINENGQAYVKEARYDSCSRNVYRYPHLANTVDIARIRNHFIFTVESVGAYPPHDIFIEAVKILKKKCRQLINELDGTDQQ